MYTLSCKDMDQPNCSFVAKGETKEEVLKASMTHAAEAHGTDPEMLKSSEMRERAMSKMQEA